MVPLSYYEIRVAGVLPSEVLPLQDQAALHGLLTRLETFAVQVIEVRRRA